MLEVSIVDQLGGFELDVAFTAPPVGVTALFGHSGSGKTSVLRAIAGITRPKRASIKFGDTVWQDDKTFVPPHRRPIGYVFQEASLFHHLSVKKNLEYGWRRIPEHERIIDLPKVMELLDIEPLLNRAVAMLSGGERQRVAMARALVTSPKLLLMDEPLTALDHAAKQKILPYLENLHDEFAIPSLYVSHDPYEVARLTDQMILLDRGKVEAMDTTANLLTRLDLPLARLDEAASMLDGTVSAHDQTYHLTWISMDGGRIAASREDLPIGKRARVEINARDVSLSLSSHSDTSIINILPAQVIDLRDISESQMIVQLRLMDGQQLLSRITRRSAYALDLHKDMHLYAQVKSVSLIG